MARLRTIGLFSFLLALLSACATPAPPTEPTFTGIWRGEISVDGTSFPITLQIHQRDDLSLFGYAVGSSGFVEVLSGVRISDRAIVVLRVKDDVRPKVLLVSGDVVAGTLVGTIDDAGAMVPITLTQASSSFDERRFVFVSGLDGDASIDLSAVFDDTGTFAGGAFGARGACGFIACGGVVDSFSETATGDIVIDIQSLGYCSGSGRLTASFDAASAFYSGTWDYTYDPGCEKDALGGALFGGRNMATNTDDAAAVLSLIGTLGDDLEDSAALPASYAGISSAYKHFGMSKANLVTTLNADIADHENRSIAMGAFEDLKTVRPVGLNPFLDGPASIRFRDDRSGTLAGSDIRVDFRNATPDDPVQSEYSYLVDEAGVWRFYGNQSEEMDLPFAYSIGTERLLVPAGTGATAGVLHLSLGGWGAHFGPLTGHLEGNGKTDMFAQYAGSPGDLTELANGSGGTPGVCDVALASSGAGEVCGFWGGVNGEIIRDRNFHYIAPTDGTVVSIEFDERPRPLSAPQTHYFDNVPHWRVGVAFEGGVEIDFVHVGRLGDVVRAGLMAATGIDADIYAPSLVPADDDYCPPAPSRCDVSLLDEADAFAISAGDLIAWSQTDAAPVPGHPGYFRGQIGPSVSPWGQVEFFVRADGGANGSPSTCIYSLLPAGKQTALAATMTADMLNPLSLRYAENDFVRPWKFRAEAELCNNGGYFYRDENDFSSIRAQLGGWYERSEAGTTADEQFTVANIHPEAGAYDPALFDTKLGTSEPTEHLIARGRIDGVPFVWDLPGVGISDVWYPTGEALELTASSITIKWRELGGFPGITAYQRAAFLLDPAEGLKIKWGPLSATLAGVSAPTLLPAEPCNDANVLCYARERP